MAGTEIMNTMDALTAQVVPARIKGFSFEEISQRLGIRPEEVVKTWQDYLASRTTMTPEEEAVLQILRLEDLLVKVNDRLRYADKAEDYELVLKMLKEIANLQGINKDLKKDAEEKLLAITKAQTAVIIQALLAIASGLQEHIDGAFAKHRTIKAIQGELAGATITQLFNEHAMRVLSQGAES